MTHDKPVITRYNKPVIVDVLLQIAENAAKRSTAEHPEDIADAMTLAIEAAGETLTEARKMGLLK